MKINIARSREDMLFCLRVKKMLITRQTQNRVIFFSFIAVALIILSGNGFTDTLYSRYALAGILFLGFAIMSYYETHISKSRGFNAADAVMNYRETDYGTKIEINDSELIFETLRNYHKFDWRSFNMFKIYKSHIFLYRNNNYANAFIVKKSELNKEEFTEFYAFLKKHMQEKK
jgi:hypothetical protein